MFYSYIIPKPSSWFSSGDEFRRFLPFLRECGYKGVELLLNDPPGVDLDKLQQWLSDLGLVVSGFMSGEAYLQDGICLCSPDLSIRRRAVQRLIQYLDTCKQFNALLVIGLMQGLRSDEPDPKIANQRIVECLGDVAAAAVDKNVKFTVDPDSPDKSLQRM